MDCNIPFWSFSTQKPGWWFSVDFLQKSYFGFRWQFKRVWSMRSCMVLLQFPLSSFPAPLDLLFLLHGAVFLLSIFTGPTFILLHDSLGGATPLRKSDFLYNSSFSLFFIHFIYNNFIIMCFFIRVFVYCSIDSTEHRQSANIFKHLLCVQLCVWSWEYKGEWDIDPPLKELGCFGI